MEPRKQEDGKFQFQNSIFRIDFAIDNETNLIFIFKSNSVFVFCKKKKINSINFSSFSIDLFVYTTIFNKNFSFKVFLFLFKLLL